MIKKFDATSVDACERPNPAKILHAPVIFARFVCSLLSFRTRKFPAKSETREPGEIIVERTSYANTGS